MSICACQNIFFNGWSLSYHHFVARRRQVLGLGSKMPGRAIDRLYLRVGPGSRELG